jgi:hypothetical protein
MAIQHILVLHLILATNAIRLPHVHEETEPADVDGIAIHLEGIIDQAETKMYNSLTIPHAMVDIHGRIMNWKGEAVSNLDFLMNDADFMAFMAEGPDRHVSKGTLDEYLDACSKDSDSIDIGHYMGRTGNNLWQLHVAIISAIRSGKKYVTTNKHPLFDFRTKGNKTHSRAYIPIDPNDENFGKGCELIVDINAGRTYDCKLQFFQRCASTVSERKAVYHKYLLPYLNVLNSCTHEQSEDVLTLHVRSGDVALARSGCHAQPNCDYFDKVINEGNDGGPFQVVNVYSSSQQPENKCINHLKLQHKDKKINLISQFLAHDYCAMVTAKNLAVSVSGMSTTAKMLNTGLNRLFYPGYDEQKFAKLGCKHPKMHSDAYDFDGKEVCNAFPNAIRYEDGVGLSACAK